MTDQAIMILFELATHLREECWDDQYQPPRDKVKRLADGYVELAKMFNDLRVAYKLISPQVQCDPTNACADKLRCHTHYLVDPTRL